MSTLTIPYSSDELAGILDRDESVNVNRLAASVLNLLTRTDQMLENQEMAAGGEEGAGDETVAVEGKMEGKVAPVTGGIRRSVTKK